MTNYKEDSILQGCDIMSLCE